MVITNVTQLLYDSMVQLEICTLKRAYIICSIHCHMDTPNELIGILQNQAHKGLQTSTVSISPQVIFTINLTKRVVNWLVV